jgi:hypothetical protein
VNIDRENSFIELIAALDFVFDPFAVICLRSEQKHSHGSAFELLLDPFLDASRSLLGLLELCLIVEWLGLVARPRQPRVANLNDTPDVAIVVGMQRSLMRERSRRAGC